MYTKLLKNFSSVGIIQISNYVLPFLYIPIITKIIGPDKFGVINFFTIFINYFVLLIGFGFDVTAVRKVASNTKDIILRNKTFNEVFNVQIILFLVSSIVFILCMVCLDQFKNEYKIALYTYISCFATLMTQNWLFQAMQEMHKVAVLNLLFKLILTMSLLFIIKEKQQYIYIALITSISNIIVAIMSFLWAYRKYNLKLKIIPFSKSIKVMKDEKTFFMSTVMISFYNNTNIILLGILQSTIAVGYYTAGQKIISIVQMILIFPLNLSLFPFFSEKFSKNINNGLIYVNKIMPILILGMLFIGICILLLAPYIIEYIFGSDYSSSIIVLQILAFIPLLSALNVLFGNHIMLNLKLDKIHLNIIVISGIVSCLVNLGLINFLSFKGAAIAWNIAEICTLIMLSKKLHSLGIKVFDIKTQSVVIKRLARIS